MASEPEVSTPLEPATLDPTCDPVVQTQWLARSDRIWTRVMPTYHLVTEEELWWVLLKAAKADE